jgi:uncharacterized protein YycO
VILHGIWVWNHWNNMYIHWKYMAHFMASKNWVQDNKMNALGMKSKFLPLSPRSLLNFLINFWTIVTIGSKISFSKMERSEKLEMLRVSLFLCAYHFLRVTRIKTIEKKKGIEQKKIWKKEIFILKQNENKKCELRLKIFKKKTKEKKC